MSRLTRLDALLSSKRVVNVKPKSSSQIQTDSIIQNDRRCTSSDYPRRSEVCSYHPKWRFLLIAISAIFNEPGRLQRDFPVPVCQCVQIKTLPSTSDGAPERYRLVLSDIGNFVQSMLATRKLAGCISRELVNKFLEANHVVHEGKLKKGSIVRLKSYQANAVKGKRFVKTMAR
jgi:hypothetical protein